MIIAISSILFSEGLNCLSILPINEPVMVSIVPIIIKSKKDQLTSSVNVIAINGIESNILTVYKILVIM